MVDASTVVATHLNHLIHMHAAELLGRQEVQSLLDRIAKESPKLTEDLGAQGHHPHRAAEDPARTRWTRACRSATCAPCWTRGGRGTRRRSAIPTNSHRWCASRRGVPLPQQWFPNGADLQVIGLDAGLERVLSQALTNGGGIEPGLADALLQHTQRTR
ncbi:FHIPEP family type III secretion protein [Cupriavidus basilensis]